MQMGERGLGIRSGMPKQAWEQTDFPIICEKCLGENPYIRMVRFLIQMKTPNGQECRVYLLNQICTRPFTVFRWKPSSKTRWKRCEICQTCAKLKNACQACVTDLNFSLPIEIRDKLIEEKDRIYIPTEQPNLDYMIDQANKHVHSIMQIEALQLPYEEQGKTLLEKAQKIAKLEIGAELLSKKKAEEGNDQIKVELLLPPTNAISKPKPPSIPPPDIIAGSRESEKQTLKDIITKSGSAMYRSMDGDFSGGKKLN